jgi:5,10-methylene-tetrahydrofolate dehydrogenase/methenyl tetrahydrofolate cyclohydrolase
MAAELYYTDSLVADTRDQTLALLDTLTADAPAVVYAAAMLPEGANAGIDSYLRQLQRYVESPNGLGGRNVRFEQGRFQDVAQAAGALVSLAGIPGTSIIMTPTAEKWQLPPLLEALAEDSSRDGDGMTEAGRMRHLPATPVAERKALEAMCGDLHDTDKNDPDRTVFIGAGAVNGPFIEQLTAEGIAPGLIINHHNSDEMIPKLHSIADRVVSAVGIAGLITPRDLIRQRGDGRNAHPLHVVDSGVSQSIDRPPKRHGTGMIHGDVDPHMYGYPGSQEIHITPAPVLYPDGSFAYGGRGVGRLTVATFVLQGLSSSMGVPLLGELSHAR